MLGLHTDSCSKKGSFFRVLYLLGTGISRTIQTKCDAILNIVLLNGIKCTLGPTHS